MYICVCVCVCTGMGVWCVRMRRAFIYFKINFFNKKLKI
jgi:hypothetical protein